MFTPVDGRLIVVVVRDSPPTITPGRRFCTMTARLAGLLTTTRDFFFFLAYFFFLTTVTLDGRSSVAITRSLRERVTATLGALRSRTTVVELPPVPVPMFTPTFGVLLCVVVALGVVVVVLVDGWFCATAVPTPRAPAVIKANARTLIGKNLQRHLPAARMQGTVFWLQDSLDYSQMNGRLCCAAFRLGEILERRRAQRRFIDGAET
jgi:hypothetical protein